MRRVPSCLLFASLALSLGALIPEGALAEPGFRFGPSAHRAFGGHKGFGHGFFRHRGYARHAPVFPKYGRHVSRFGFHGFGHYRPLRHVYGGYGPGFYGHYGHVRNVYGHHHYGRAGYGYSGYGHHGYGRGLYGRHGYGHHGYGRHFYGRHGYGYVPHSTWLWPASNAYADATVVIDAGGAPPDPVVAVIPSLADLPVSTGIRSAPAASPAIYVVGSDKRSLRPGRAKIVSLDQDHSQAEASGGPRIIRLDGR